MPSSTGSGSYLAALATSRRKMSATRQALSLENSPQVQRGQMQPLAPSPPEGADMDKSSPMKDAVQNSTFEVPDDWDFPEMQRDEIRGMVRQHLIDTDGDGVGDTPAPAQPQTPPSNTPNPPQTDARANAALAPLTDFFRQNGRIPNPEELKDMAAKRSLTDSLGRAPTDQEVMLYRATPPKSG